MAALAHVGAHVGAAGLVAAVGAAVVVVGGSWCVGGVALVAGVLAYGAVFCEGAAVGDCLFEVVGVADGDFVSWCSVGAGGGDVRPGGSACGVAGVVFGEPGFGGGRLLVH